ncbi:MAG: helix-turn-helix transcriptional regulator [Gammaproteobacteria bacterium]
MADQTPKEEYIPKKEVAALLDISPATVDRWERSNPRFPQGSRLNGKGGAVRWSRAAILRFASGEE